MPQIEILDLQIEVRQYQYLEANEYYDANWLDVGIRYAGLSSKIWFDEPCLLTVDLLAFRDELISLSELGTDKASLTPLEPYIRLDIKRVGSLGGLEVDLVLRPDPVCESHRLTMSADLSYLPRVIAQLNKVLAQFPVRLETQCSSGCR